MSSVCDHFGVWSFHTESVYRYVPLMEALTYVSGDQSHHESKLVYPSKHRHGSRNSRRGGMNYYCKEEQSHSPKQKKPRENEEPVRCEADVWYRGTPRPRLRPALVGLAIVCLQRFLPSLLAWSQLRVLVANTFGVGCELRPLLPTPASCRTSRAWHLLVPVVHSGH